jgi:hypothetical protein
MKPQTHNSPSSEHSPRLVLISAEEPDPQQAQQPVRIIGSEPRLTGNFRLTDR